MRLFIGIPFSESVRSRIRKNMTAIQPTIVKGKLSSWEGYHLTLRFLGEVPEEKLAALTRAMAETSLHTHPFEMTFTALGAFKKSKGDVLWLGVAALPALTSLYEEVEALAESAGFEKEPGNYVPHITLGRGVRYQKSLEETACHWKPVDVGEWVEQIALFQSVQTAGQLTYVPLVTLGLSGAETNTGEAQKEVMP